MEQPSKAQSVWKVKPMKIPCYYPQTCTNHAISGIILYQPRPGKNSRCYGRNSSSQCIRHVCFSIPEILVTEASHNLHCSCSGQDNMAHIWRTGTYIIRSLEPSFSCLLMIFSLNTLIAWKITATNSLVVRTFSVSRSKFKYSKYANVNSKLRQFVIYAPDACVNFWLLHC